MAAKPTKPAPKPAPKKAPPPKAKKPESLREQIKARKRAIDEASGF